MANFSLKNKVTVHYTGSFDDGEVFDTTRDRAPLTYVEGNHEVVPGFEAAVISMEPGEHKRVHLAPREAYGERNPNLLMAVPTVQVPNYDDLVVGGMIYLMDERGYQRLARVVQVQDDGMTVFDFNHPMAGCSLTFDLELIAREPLDEDEAGSDAAAAADGPADAGADATAASKGGEAHA